MDTQGPTGAPRDLNRCNHIESRSSKSGKGSSSSKSRKCSESLPPSPNCLHPASESLSSSVLPAAMKKETIVVLQKMGQNQTFPTNTNVHLPAYVRGSIISLISGFGCVCSKYRLIDGVLVREWNDDCDTLRGRPIAALLRGLFHELRGIHAPGTCMCT